MKVLYCLCGKSYRICPSALVAAEWIEREWFKAHRGKGHGRVDVLTFERMKVERMRWLVENGIRRREAKKGDPEGQQSMVLGKGGARV